MKLIKNVAVTISALTHDSYILDFNSDYIASNAVPGQFVNLYLPYGEHLLPRPISICNVNAESGNVRLIYREVGQGTRKLKELNYLKILGPLGNGFSIPNHSAKHIIVGGGLGIPPLLFLSSRLIGEIDVYLGAKFEPILINEFLNLNVTVHVASDEGLNYFKGTSIDLMGKNNADGDFIYACGPLPMLKAVSNYASRKNIIAHISMEERMGCGFGACVGCAIKIQNNDEDWRYLKVCKDGPVFNSREVVWDE